MRNRYGKKVVVVGVVMVKEKIAETNTFYSFTLHVRGE
jgi:hypothetical protein